MSFAEFCVKRPVFTTMLVALFVVTGVFSFRDLSVDLLPKADPAVIQEGNARITLKFVLERDINDAAQDVREKVAQAVRDLPPEVQPPIITKVDPDADPVVSFALSGTL